MEDLRFDSDQSKLGLIQTILKTVPWAQGHFRDLCMAFGYDSYLPQERHRKRKETELCQMSLERLHEEMECRHVTWKERNHNNIDGERSFLFQSVPTVSTIKKLYARTYI